MCWGRSTTLLCSPGMNVAVKIDDKINRKTVLLLNSVIEGSPAQDGEAALELLKLAPSEDTEEPKTFADECLKKAGLKELKTLQAK
jgi:hypothetical protein